MRPSPQRCHGRVADDPDAGALRPRRELVDRKTRGRDGAHRLVTAAVANNAAWCDAVCRSLGLVTARTPTLWAVHDPPRWYPHRIDLTSDVAAEDAIAGLSDSEDAWVKDFFATLDMSEYGFNPAMLASWCTARPARRPQ